MEDFVERFSRKLGRQRQRGSPLPPRRIFPALPFVCGCVQIVSWAQGAVTRNMFVERFAMFGAVGGFDTSLSLCVTRAS